MFTYPLAHTHTHTPTDRQVREGEECDAYARTKWAISADQNTVGYARMNASIGKVGIGKSHMTEQHRWTVHQQ